MTKTTEQQVEELEEEFFELKNALKHGKEEPISSLQRISNSLMDKRLNEIIKEVKSLKAEIEKGCGESMYVGNRLWTTCCEENYNKYGLCPSCKNLINRLNKIIGEKE